MRRKYSQQALGVSSQDGYLSVDGCCDIDRAPIIYLNIATAQRAGSHEDYTSIVMA